MSGGGGKAVLGTYGKVISGGLLTNTFSNWGAGLDNMFKAPGAPDLKSPTALSTTPSQADAEKKATNEQLLRERQQASTSTTLTSGAGLLDQPTTTSTTLLGA